MSTFDGISHTVLGLSTAESLTALQLPHDSFLIYATVEGYERANVDLWETVVSAREPDTFAVVSDSPGGGGAVDFECDGQMTTLDPADLSELADLIPHESHLVIDISGVGHEFWANCMVRLRGEVAALSYVYTEPSSYRFRSGGGSYDAFDTTLFDLSDLTRGVRALPGFANLMGAGSTEDAVFVPLLGFEGWRALNVLNELDPVPREVIPVVGVPGYRPEFPSYTILCNGAFFSETSSASSIRLAAANDPFDLRTTLQGIREDCGDRYMYVAPIGTRPHAVGALMFAVDNPETVEILFDHPVRKSGSREGTGKSHLYRVF